MNRSQIETLARSLKAEIIETHISWVLLDARFAYKIKKPVKTNFLDFSSLPKRKKFCELELKLNQELAPDMYLKTVSIDDSCHLKKEGGRIIEYAVKLKRMKVEKQMDIMLSKNLVKERPLQNLAKRLAMFHATSTVIKSGVSSQKIKHDFMDLRSLDKIILRYFDEHLLNSFFKAIKEANKFFKGFSKQYHKRVKDGFIRDLHGDLHSANIFLYKNPIIFDRIEFNRHFREIDVLHEVAFLCMDLEKFKKKHLSKVFLSKYLMYSGFYFGKEEENVFNFYKCYTANVRAKVNLIRLENIQDLKEKKEVKLQVLKYLKIMFIYASKLKDAK